MCLSHQLLTQRKTCTNITSAATWRMGKNFSWVAYSGKPIDSNSSMYPRCTFITYGIFAASGKEAGYGRSWQESYPDVLRSRFRRNSAEIFISWNYSSGNEEKKECQNTGCSKGHCLLSLALWDFVHLLCLLVNPSAKNQTFQQPILPSAFTFLWCALLTFHCKVFSSLCHDSGGLSFKLHSSE